MTRAKVAIIMGSDSDLSVMKEAAYFLDEVGVPYTVHISSAHRVPEKTAELAKNAEKQGVEVIIAGAGGAAHLAGVIAAVTPLPVIGVPIGGSALNGVDALYAMVQMPAGIPVATVAINGAKNAGILAAQILAVQDQEMRQKIKEYKEKMAQAVIKKDEKLNEIGIDAYLAEKTKNRLLF